MESLKKAFGSSSLNKNNNTQPDTESPWGQPLSQPNLNPGYYGEFPESFSIYLSKRTKEKTTRKTDYFFIVHDSDGKIKPLNVISSDKHTVEHQLTLFSGTECSSPPLALSGINKRPGSVYHNVALPARNENFDGTANNVIRLNTDPNLKNKLYRFKLDVGRDQHSETFEWRTEPAIQSRPRKDKPFKCCLVRLKGGSISGEEVVASYVEGDAPMITAKLGTFNFEGSATTSYLGPYWTLAAVVSLLNVIQLRWLLRLAAEGRVKRVAKKFTVGVIYAAATGSGGPSVGI